MTPRSNHGTRGGGRGRRRRVRGGGTRRGEEEKEKGRAPESAMTQSEGVGLRRGALSSPTRLLAILFCSPRDNSAVEMDSVQDTDVAGLRHQRCSPASPSAVAISLSAPKARSHSTADAARALSNLGHLQQKLLRTSSKGRSLCLQS